MLPDDIIESESEKFASSGSSSLPMTNTLQDPDNLDITSNFLYLLHEKNCLGGPPHDNTLPCRESCVFWRLACFRSCVIHYMTCTGETCTTPHCKQAVALYEHWKMCDKPTCGICISSVNLILENFCAFLARKNPVQYNEVVIQIRKADLAVRKSIIKSNVSLAF